MDGNVFFCVETIKTNKQQMVYFILIWMFELTILFLVDLNIRRKQRNLFGNT